MAYPIGKLRTLFEIAVDVKDNALEVAFFEADMLDLKPQIGMGYELLPTEYKNGTEDAVGGEKNPLLLRVCTLFADSRPKQYIYWSEITNLWRVCCIAGHEQI